MLKANDFVYGTYTSQGVECEEASLSGLVPRVIIKQTEFDMNSKHIRGTQLGRKRKFEQVSLETNERGRGRPRKELHDDKGNSDSLITRGRKGKKFNFQTNLRPLTATRINVKSNKEKRLNGFRSNRIRKQSSRLSGFIVNSKADTDDQGSAKVVKNKPKVVEKTEDPLDISNFKDEVVHSFLPVFNKKPKIQYEARNFKLKRNENKKLVASKAKENSPVKAACEEAVKSETDVEGEEADQNVLPENQEAKVEENIHLQSMTSKLQQKLNKIPDKNDNQSSYRLVINEVPLKKKANSCMDFNRLVRSLKLVKLPAKEWKIRIVVSKQQTITEVTFTNKETHERCVKFSRAFSGFSISFGTSVVKLLGAPTNISSYGDVTVLLDIIHNIALNDQLLEYEENTKSS